MLSLHGCAGVFSSYGEWRLLSSCGVQASHFSGFCCCRAQSSVVVVNGLSHWDSWALENTVSKLWHMGLVAPRQLRSGIFPDQGLNPCLLHWQVDSLSLSHQGRAYF